MINICAYIEVHISQNTVEDFIVLNQNIKAQLFKNQLLRYYHGK